MPFKQVFERRVNEDMQDGGAGPAPRSPSPTPSFVDTDVKKQPHSHKAKSIYEAEDLDLSSKGDKTLPPRFSTLFDTTRTADPAPPTPRVVECCHRESRKRSGVHLSTPVFILLVVVLLFESTLLFAYTVIGLYQNLPSGILSIAGAPAPVDGCHCEDESKQGVINFSPNFVFGEKGGEVMGQLSVIESMTALPSSATSTATTSPSSTPTTTTSSTTFSSSSSVSIVTETPGVVHSTIVVTSSAESSETDTAVQPTVTSVQIVDGPNTTIQARSPTSAAASEGAEEATGTAAPTPTVTGDESPDTVDDDASGAEGEDGAEHDENGNAQNTAGPCFGASEAVMLNCI